LFIISSCGRQHSIGERALRYGLVVKEVAKLLSVYSFTDTSNTVTSIPFRSFQLLNMIFRIVIDKYDDDKFKNVVEIYLDTDWHRARKIRMQNFAQQIRIKQQNIKAQESKRKTMEARNSAKRFVTILPQSISQISQIVL